MNLDKLSKSVGSFLGASDVIKNFPDSVIFVDSCGYITSANKKAVECFGLECNALIEFESIIKDGIKSIEESINIGQPVLAKALINGKEAYVELNAVKSKENYCVCIRNISTYVNETSLNDKIERFNGEKNAMLFKLESDIISPLSSITGFSKGLLEGLGGVLSEKQAKYVKIINNNAGEVLEFLQKLLEFTYAESSLYEQEFCQFDIVAELKNIFKDFSSVMKEKNLDFEFEYSLIDNRSVYWDVKALRLIIKNIIEVAISSTDTGKISVNLVIPDEETCISYNLNENRKYIQILIKDTGVGIEARELRYLFDPYSQLEKGKKNILRSFKLGASSIFAKRSGGFIDISSELVHGTEYSVIIPIDKEQE